MYNKIEIDLKEAMKNQDKFRLSLIRMLKTALIYDSRSGEKHELSDDDCIATIKRQIKTRKSSIEEYQKYNRLDLVNDLEKEIEILSSYLPEELSDEELETIINSIIEEVNPTSMRDMGIIMKKVSEKVGASADMSKVSSIVKSKINI